MCEKMNLFLNFQQEVGRSLCFAGSFSKNEDHSWPCKSFLTFKGLNLKFIFTRSLLQRAAVRLSLVLFFTKYFIHTHCDTFPVSVQASGSEAAHILASGRLGKSSTLQHPASGHPEGQDPDWAKEAEPRRPPQAEPGEDTILPSRETLWPLQAALPASLQLLNRMDGSAHEWGCV